MKVTVEGYNSPSESLSWKPFDVRWGIVRDQGSGALVCEGGGRIDWDRLDAEERIALGYLLSKALGHPQLLLDGAWSTP